MVNGGGTPAAMFAPLMAEIEGHSLYAVDWPGHGLSDLDPGFASDLRQHSTRRLRGVLQALRLDRPAVIANSFGSWVSTWLAVEDPEAMPDARLHVVSAGQAPWLRHPHTVGRLINEFLEDAGQPSAVPAALQGSRASAAGRGGRSSDRRS